MANQVTVSNDHSISVTIEPPANVQVQISRAVIGTVANVASANLANYVIQNSQPNITSVGTLVGLTSNGNITAPFFIGNVVGNISGNFTVPGINTAVLFNQTGNAGASDALTFNYSSNVLTANGNIVANYFIGNGSQLTGIVTQQSNNANYANYANFANVANIANSVAGANVSGIVANANYSAYSSIAGVANSVAVANVSGIGNIATVNLDGNASNILYGNGVFSAVPNVANVANANYANFAGNAFSVNASNIVGTVNLANFATTANAVAGANVSGTVANATYATSAGSANTAATVTTNAQPNITSVGTLTGLVVGGDITPNANITYSLGNNTNRFNNLYLAGNTIILGAQTISANASGISVSGNLSGDASGLANITGANVTGTVANANYSVYSGTASTANSVAGANVSGIVANANYSAYSGIAGSANSVAVANVSGIGNIATVNLDGNVSNLLTGSGTFVAIPTVSSNANYANFAGQVVDATQSNITTVGSLTNLTVSGNAIITGNLVVNGNTTSVNSNTIYIEDPVIEIGGGANGDPLTINDGRDRGSVLDYYTTAPISAFMGWKNANGRFEFASNVTLANNVVTVNQLANISADYYIGNGSQLTGITATTGNANYANFAGEAFSVSAANIVGTVNLANFATTANSVAGANVSGAVAYATTANSVAGANVSGAVSYAAVANSVALANVSGAGNIASINLDGNVSNLLTGAGTYVAIPTVSSNANYANFAGTVITNAQPNITSVGTLTNLTVSGIITTTTIESPTGGGANIDIAPDGIGHVNINADTLRVGDNNVDAQILTRGTGNLTLKTHDVEANESNIKIINGVTGNIQLNPKGIVVTTSNVQANYFIGNGSSLTSITGGNVTGAVAFATTANAVAGANVSGAVAYATTANSVAGANVSGAVAFATTANSVAVGNVSGIGNIATINLNANASQVLYGNGVFAAIAGGGGSSISNGNSNVDIATANGNVTLTAVGNTTMTITGTGANITGYANVANLLTTKYSETVIAGGNTGATLSPNVSAGTIFNYTANSNFTFSTLTNAVAGSGVTVIITQDATGNRILTSTMKFLGGAKTLSTTANAIDIMSVFYDGTTYYASLGKGFS